MEKIPVYVYVTFGLTILATVYLFYKSTLKSRGFIVLISLWMIVQSMVAIAGFYTVTDTLPPRFSLLLLPPLLFIIIQFLTKSGRAFIDRLDLRFLTIVHIVRIPVEIVLYWLFLAKAVPGLMTFEGKNFDIFSGITSPIVYYVGFIKRKLHKSILIAWNIGCLVLLSNIILRAALSAPTPWQQFGFDQPNIAVLHFPFIFLPAVIVPIILFSHLASIRKIILTK